MIGSIEDGQILPMFQLTMIGIRLSSIFLYALDITITANAILVGSLIGLLGVPQVINMI